MNEEQPQKKRKSRLSPPTIAGQDAAAEAPLPQVTRIDPAILAEMDRRDRIAEERATKLAAVVADTVTRKVAAVVGQVVDQKISETMGSLGGLLGGGAPEEPDASAGVSAEPAPRSPRGSTGASRLLMRQAITPQGGDALGALIVQALLNQLQGGEKQQPSANPGALTKMIEDANAVAELMNRPYNKGRQDALKEVNSFLALAKNAGLSPEDAKKRLAQALGTEINE